jgi:hypothetical protein
MHTTKISGLAVDTEYTFQLVLRTSAGTYNSEKLVVKTHKMTDLSGITVTAGVLPAQLRDSLTKAIERIGAKLADTVRIDTTHFVTVEGRGLAWEKALEMNIPVVRPEWVEGCERGGRIVGVRQYYLDADPKLRQVEQQQPPQPQPSPPQPSPTRETPKSPSPTRHTNGADGTIPIPPTPPAKDHPQDEEESSSEEEEEENKSSVRDEQKVRVEDREQQKVALRPGGPSPKEKDVEKEGSEDSSSGSGSRTPGQASFQNIEL